MNRKKLRALPKAEIHRHLDGSVRFETITDLWQRYNLDLGAETTEELRRKTKIVAPMQDLTAVLESFWTTQKVLCNYEAIKRITFENIEDAYRDGVRLLELRFAPAFIAFDKELSNDEIIEGVLDGLNKGMDTYQIQIGLIGIVPRNLGLAENRAATADLLSYRSGRYRNGDRICGFDLAAGEQDVDPHIFVALIEQARDGGLGITVHTGENSDVDSVEQSLQLYRPQRIGHGIKIWGHEATMEKIRRQKIMLELCPTSNWLTNSVPSLAEHPLPDFYRYGLNISINSDDPHLFDIDLVHEYALCQQQYGLDLEDLLAINRNTVNNSFLAEEIKTAVLKDFFTLS